MLKSGIQNLVCCSPSWKNGGLWMLALSIALAPIALAGCSANARFDLTEFRSEQPPAASANLGVKTAEIMKRSPATNALPASNEPPAAKESPRFIYVANGDTLALIANRYSVRPEDLMSANGLATSNIEPGQYLALPVRPNDALVARPKLDAPY
jgi:hypothetical protein